MGGACTSDYPSLSEQLQKDHKELQKIASDGNCLFRAISHQIRGNETAHRQLRADACSYIREHPDQFKDFFEEGETIENYVYRMSQDMQWGDNYAISALAMKYKYKFIIYESYQKKKDICFTKEPSFVIYLAYLNKRHYNSVVDKGSATKKASACMG